MEAKIMELKQLPKQIIAGFVVVISVTVIVIWELLKGIFGEVLAFISLFITVVLLIFTLKYTGVI
jgi:hypothetical protein